ncbi:MAG: phosphoadenylyl-sulfate reductase [Bacteroidales bacterium]|nr:phosphoadenylyl-sulfate reductase [Bacteroidales bacterium]
MEKRIEKLQKLMEAKSAEEILSFFVNEFEGNVALGSSLGAEDQVLTDMLSETKGKFTVFTFDTGRLFQEIHDLIEITNEKYDINIDIYFPNQQDVEKMVNEKGVNLFYKSIENRKECCRIRKIEPLKRALADVDIWVTGLRKDQSLTRFYTPLVEWEEQYKVIKANPLLSWTEKQVWAYIKKHNVPYNPLHDKGYPSIGCQPCTRAVKPGEDFRAGRWWWESPEHSECGLHVKE